MSPSVDVSIHESQFPENVRRDLLKSLRSRRVNHKFHYDSIKQTQKWLALHRQFSPSRHDADCRAIYDRSFKAVARSKATQVHVIGLGCGGGQKDTRLLKQLKARGKKVSYTPCDVSTAMVLVARRTALSVVSSENCFPLVCDLATAGDLASIFDSRATHHASRIATFFGMIPNFEPGDILPKLASLLEPSDVLLFSANLAPGDDYAAGMNRVLPQYDNGPTRDWLMTFLSDLGIDERQGRLQFEIEPMKNGLKRVVARFRFRQTCRVTVDDDKFEKRWSS